MIFIHIFLKKYYNEGIHNITAFCSDVMNRYSGYYLLCSCLLAGILV